MILIRDRAEFRHHLAALASLANADLNSFKDGTSGHAHAWGQSVALQRVFELLQAWEAWDGEQAARLARIKAGQATEGDDRIPF